MKKENTKRKKFLNTAVFLTLFVFAFGAFAQLNNPLGVSTLAELAAKITKFALVYVASPIAVGAVIYSGYLFMVSQGNPEQLKKARQALIYAISGAILIAVALGFGEVIRTFYKK